MKALSRIICTLLLVAFVCSPVLAKKKKEEEEEPPPVEAIIAQTKVPDIFRKTFDGDERAYKLDESYVIFNNRISAVLEEYYYQRKKIFDFILPAFIYEKKNLARSYRAYEASVEERDKVYEAVQELLEKNQTPREEALAGFNEEERIKGEEMWGILKRDTEERVAEFFDIEEKFLKRYKNHVKFLQARSGDYGFSGRRIVFTDMNDRQYYAKSADTLRSLDDMQFKVLLRQNIIARE